MIRRLLFNKTLFVILAILSSYHVSFTQVIPDKVGFEATMFGYKLKQGNLPIGRDRMRSLMRNYPTQLKEFNSGNTSLAVSTLFQLVGLVAIGGYASDRIFNNKVRNELLIGGGALLAISIPINVSSKRKIGTAVVSYNLSKMKD